MPNTPPQDPAHFRSRSCGQSRAASCMWPALAPLLLLAAGAQRRHLPGRPGRTYAQLQPLFDAVDLQPGDIVEVDGNATYDAAHPASLREADGGAARQPGDLRGLRINGQRPILRGGTNTIEFRLVRPRRVRKLRSQRHRQRQHRPSAASTTTPRCHHPRRLIHDCPRHGILGADNDSGSLLVEYSEIRNAGSGGSNHAIYMATDEMAHPGSVFRLQYSYVHDSQLR